MIVVGIVYAILWTAAVVFIIDCYRRTMRAYDRIDADLERITKANERIAKAYERLP